jgi:[ribosomal protein S5]-alanine N-acetyltransferase
MKKIVETERLLLREIELSDVNDMFEMDSDPAVHIYIENQPVKTKEEVRDSIIYFQNQQIENGVSAYAVIDKQSDEFLGWAGFLYSKEPVNNQINFYELGYRFKKKHWGKGYATEACQAIIKYAFDRFKINAIYALTDPNNEGSKKVLLKLGFKFINTFDYEGQINDWYELKRE